MKHFLLTILTAFACTAISVAQSYEAGIWLGGINYFGEVNTTTDFLDSRISGGLLGKYNFDSRLSGEVSVSYGQVYELDRTAPNATNYQTLRNEAIRTKVLDVSVSAEFNFFSFRTLNNFEEPKDFTPYLGAGIGFSSISPEIFLRNQGWTKAGNLPTEDDKQFSSGLIQVPLSAGVKYKLNSNFNLGAEFTSHILFTDYFDDLSTTYNNFSQGENIGAITTVGRQRGDRFKNDSYNLFGLQLTYVIPIVKCPGQ